MSDPVVLNAAAHLLNHLESGDDIQIPYVMRRIRDLLVAKITDDCEKTHEAVERPTEPALEKASALVVNNGWEEDEWRDEWQYSNQQYNTDELIVQRFREAVRTLEATDAPLYVDVQFLISEKGEYVIKEFCAQCDEGPTAWVTVKSPVDAVPNVDENDYVKRHINGMDWYCGVLDFEELRSMTNALFGHGRRVYVKGGCKIKALVDWLAVSRRNIIDLVHLPKLQTIRRNAHMEEECPYHKDKFRFACAKKHTCAMIESNRNTSRTENAQYILTQLDPSTRHDLDFIDFESWNWTQTITNLATHRHPWQRT